MPVRLGVKDRLRALDWRVVSRPLRRGFYIVRQRILYAIDVLPDRQDDPTHLPASSSWSAKATTARSTRSSSGTSRISSAFSRIIACWMWARWTSTPRRRYGTARGEDASSSWAITTSASRGSPCTMGVCRGDPAAQSSAGASRRQPLNGLTFYYIYAWAQPGLRRRKDMARDQQRVALTLSAAESRITVEQRECVQMQVRRA